MSTSKSVRPVSSFLSLTCAMVERSLRIDQLWFGVFATGRTTRSTGAMRLRRRLRTLRPAWLYRRQTRLWFACQPSRRPTVLLLQRLEPLRLGHGHAAELRLPAAVCRLGDSVPAVQLRWLDSRIGLLEHADDLVLRESLLHYRSFANGLYIVFVLLTGSRSGAR